MSKKPILKHLWPSPFLWEEEDLEMGNGNLSISEDKTHVYIEAAVPGMKMDDIELTYHKGVLEIHAEKKEESKDKEKKFYRKAMQEFSYRVYIPGQVDESKEPQATYQDGIMKITFDKMPQEAPKKIKIKKS